MSRWQTVALMIAAIVYFVLPWDLDFVPVVGRLDDLVFLAVAGYYYWKQTRHLGGAAGRRPSAERPSTAPPPPGAQRDGDPYRLFGVSRSADAETIKKAYRDLVAKYHPDRVQHLGEEFKELAAAKTTAINTAYEEIKTARNFS